MGASNTVHTVLALHVLFCRLDSEVIWIKTSRIVAKMGNMLLPAIRDIAKVDVI